MSLNQSGLAELAGVTRPTANRVLRRLETAGAVSLSRGALVVRDPAVLRRAAGPEHRPPDPRETKLPAFAPMGERGACRHLRQAVAAAAIWSTLPIDVDELAGPLTRIESQRLRPSTPGRQPAQVGQRVEAAGQGLDPPGRTARRVGEVAVAEVGSRTTGCNLWFETQLC